MPARRAAPSLALAVCLGVLAAGSGVALVAVSAWLLARAAEQPPVLYLMVAIVLVRAFGIGKAVFRYGERLVGHSAALRMLGDVRIEVYRRWERLYPGGIRLLGGSAARSGDVIARAVTDTDAVVDLSVRVTVPIVAAGAVALAAVGASWLLLPASGVVLAISVVLTGVVLPVVTARRGGRAQSSVAPARGAMAAVVAENLAAAAELRVYGISGAGVDAVMAADADLAVAQRRGVGVDAFATAMGVLVVGGTTIAQLLVGAEAVAAGTLAAVELGVVVLLPVALQEVVGQVSPAVARWQQVRSSLRRLSELDRLPEPVPEPAPGVRAHLDQATDGAGDGAHRIRLREVSAFWPGSPDARDDPTAGIRGIDLDLGGTRRVGVVGRSGAGKSTLAMVLERFLDTTGGTFEVDGVDVAALAADDVRRIIGLQTQDAHVFDTTVTENLRPADPAASPEQLRAVLGRVGLDGWLGSLPRGLDTPLGTDGRAMSGGERQRLGLARLLLSDHPVLVFDEPAEHLDPDAASSLLGDLLRETSDRSVLLITHARQGLAACDEVLVIDAGTVVDRGTYAELAARPGPFADLMGPDPLVTVGDG